MLNFLVFLRSLGFRLIGFGWLASEMRISPEAILLLMCCISLMSLGLLKFFISVKNFRSWVWILPVQLTWRYRSKTPWFAVCIALDWCYLYQLFIIILPRNRSEWPGLTLHKRRIEGSSQFSPGHRPGRSDSIGRLFQRQDFQHMSCMLHRLCRNHPHRFQIVRLIWEYIQR